MASLAEMERELTVERTRAPLESARQLGRKGGCRRSKIAARVSAPLAGALARIRPESNHLPATLAIRSLLPASATLTASLPSRKSRPPWPIVAT